MNKRACSYALRAKGRAAMMDTTRPIQTSFMSLS